MDKVLFSKKSDEWGTPKDLFDTLNTKYNFTVDVCATKGNTKCRKFYTIEDDGLSKDWKNEVVWCNPPYSRIKDWVKKMVDEKVIGVMLVPARTDTKWFHAYIYNRYKVEFIKGRLKFEGGKYSAPFPSMLIYFQ